MPKCIKVEKNKKNFCENFDGWRERFTSVFFKLTSEIRLFSIKSYLELFDMDKATIVRQVKTNFDEIGNDVDGFIQRMRGLRDDTIKYMQDLHIQATSDIDMPLITKTPRGKKQGIRIKTINEDAELKDDSVRSSEASSIASSLKLEVTSLHDISGMDNATIGRPKRGASIKASVNIKKLQLIKGNTKMRREDFCNEDNDEPLFDKVCFMKKILISFNRLMNSGLF